MRRALLSRWSGRACGRKLKRRRRIRRRCERDGASLVFTSLRPQPTPLRSFRDTADGEDVSTGAHVRLVLLGGGMNIVEGLAHHAFEASVHVDFIPEVLLQVLHPFEV